MATPTPRKPKVVRPEEAIEKKAAPFGEKGTCPECGAEVGTPHFSTCSRA